jgi:hypothetical protein
MHWIPFRADAPALSVRWLHDQHDVAKNASRHSSVECGAPRVPGNRRGRRQPWAGAIRPLHASLVLVTGLPRHSINMSALTKENIDKLPSGEAIHPSLFCSADRTFPFLIPSCDIAVTPGHRTPSLHQPVSRRSSISAGHGQSGGPMHNVDIGKIGIPVVTPRKERPSHKRSHTGKLSPDTADLC